jgi:hypothetical protein
MSRDLSISPVSRDEVGDLLTPLLDRIEVFASRWIARMVLTGRLHAFDSNDRTRIGGVLCSPVDAWRVLRRAAA